MTSARVPFHLAWSFLTMGPLACGSGPEPPAQMVTNAGADGGADWGFGRDSASGWRPDGGLDGGMGTGDGGAAPEPALLPGTGLDRFVRLRSEDVLDWIAGPQGGHHVFGGISVAEEVLQGLDEAQRDDVVSGYRLLDAEDQVLASALRLPQGDELRSAVSVGTRCCL